ncbi:MAG: methyltransferase domain-containing protein [Pseudomonadota bacterium]
MENSNLSNNRHIPRLVECALFDGYNVPYDNSKFDLAILSHVIEHVEYPRRLLYEAKRVAKYVFVEVPCEDTLRLKRDFVFDKVGHINSYSPKTIRRLVQTCNLKVLKQITVNPQKELYTFQKGKKGLINYYIKKYLLYFSPLEATNIFTYHSALICQDAS